MFESVQVPAPLKQHLERFAEHWRSTAPQDCQSALLQHLEQQASLRQELARAVIGSEFIADWCLALPQDFIALLASDLFQRELDDEAISQYLDRSQSEPADVEGFERNLRLCRREFMVRIVWRDLNCLSTLENTTRELSSFASACIQRALDFHYPLLAQQRGLPVGARSGAPQPMLVLGMGKLGAEELNVSSDIDLIFTFPESGGTQGRPGALSNQEFFVRLGQRIIKSLDAITSDGFVFRVDMRLRPYGGSGSLAMSFGAMENYYQTQGREWERYAMIKARVVAATSESVLAETADALELKTGRHSVESYSQELMQLLQPFTFRRYLDFSAIEAMRAMKQLISREVSRKGLHNDVKLGAGGIRELEFIVQVFQLIRGGREPQLQERQLLKVLPLLVQAGCLPQEVAQDLEQAYRLLRDVEHALQGFMDRQTQQLPLDKDHQLRLAWVLGFESWDEFMMELHHQRSKVSAQFREIIAEPDERQEEGTPADAAWHLLWQGSLGTAAAQEFLRDQGIEKVDFVYHLEQLRESRAVTRMLATTRDRLDQLMPRLLADLVSVPNPEETLERICSVLEAVARRSAYIVLLVENPPARQQLIKLCSASIWIARELSDQPVLLDELLDVRTLYSPPDMDRLRTDLRRHTLRLEEDDLEAQMEALRYFRRSHALRVAACEVSGLLPLMKVSDYLTFLAEVILEYVLDLAWKQMVATYGHPQRADGSLCSVDPEHGDFIIVGYGKLGGIELGHGSDLDLVFIHRADPNLSTDGERSIDNATFFMRLGHKIIHILTTQTVLGKLYEIDMRLRPSGNSGLLVTTLNAFAKYQENEAWTWEHQALVRARVVAGSRNLAREFDSVRERVLSRERNIAELRQDVVAMREKMRKHRRGSAVSGSGSAGFHVKHDPGGIVDIEFMVQYAVLAWARSYPTLTRYTDNIRILGCLAEAGLIGHAEAEQLVEAYKAYRSTVHRLALQGLPSRVGAHEFLRERSLVTKLWQQLLIIRS